MTKRSARELFSTVGVDLGDRKSRLCVLDREGEVVEEAWVPTTRAAFERKFGSLDRSRVVLEAGTHANWVHDVLVERGHEVIVADPRRLPAISQNARKCDESDARLLAEIGQAKVSLLKPVRVRAAESRLDLTLIRARAALVEARTALVNSARGLAKAAGHRLPTCSSASLHKQELHESLKRSLAPVLGMLAHLTKAIGAYDREIEELGRTRYTATQLLRKVNGVGPLISLFFVLAIGDPKRFEDVRDVGAYFGLVPRRNQSGDRDPQLRISKCGDRMGRALLVQGAHHILGPHGQDSDLRRFGLRLAARGGKSAKKRAVIATARKLAVLLLVLLRTAELYEPLRHGATKTTS